MNLAHRIVGTVCLFGLISSASADVSYWEGLSKDDPEGTWQNDDHWFGDAPGADDTARFDLDVSMTVEMTQHENVRRLAVAGPLTLFDSTGSPRRLIVDEFSHSAFARFEGIELEAIDVILNMHEHLQLIGGSQLILHEMDIAAEGGVTLLVDASELHLLSTEGFTDLGVGAGDESGLLHVRNGSLVSIGHGLHVAPMGHATGEMRIETGSTVHVEDRIKVGWVGSNMSSDGVLIVDGESTLDQSDGGLRIGAAGTGPIARFELTGSSSYLADDGDTTVFPQGRLVVDDSTIESAGTLIVSGEVDVDGDSIVTYDAGVEIVDGLIALDGAFDTGAGMTLQSGTLDLGIADVTLRALTVDETSTLDVGASTLRFVGSGESSIDGLMTVSSSSAVVPRVLVEDAHEITSGGWVFGWDPTEAGRLQVGPRGGAERPTITTNAGGGMTFGLNGHGQATIVDGGLIDTGTVALGLEAGGTATMSVEGTDSSVRSRLLATNVWVGTAGDATLDVLDGAEVAVDDDVIVAGAGGESTLTVGGSSDATNAQLGAADLYLGGDVDTPGGVGALLVNADGEVQIISTTRVWDLADLTIADGGRLSTMTLDISHGGDFLNAGRLEVQNVVGNVENFDGGTVSLRRGPSGGSISGGFLQNATGTLEVTVGGTDAIDYSHVDCGGGLLLGGTLDVVIEGGADLEGADLTILTGLNRTGTFASVNGPADMEVVYEDDAVRLVFGSAPTCEGDVNGDGVVNVDDLIAVLSAWGPCADCDEDFTGDGIVDVNELIALLANWGTCP